MKKFAVILLAFIAICANAQKTQLSFVNNSAKGFIPKQDVHTYDYKRAWASVHCPTNNDSKFYPKVRIEFAEEKPANIGIIYDFYVGDSIKTSYVMPSETTDNKTFVASFLPIHRNIAGVSLFAFKPEVGIVKVKKATLISASGKDDRELHLVANDYGGFMLSEDITNKYSGTIVFERQWQAVNIVGVEGRTNATVTIKSANGFGKDIQVGLVYTGSNGEDVIDYTVIENAKSKIFSVKSRPNEPLKGAFIQIKTPDCPRTFLEIEGAYIN